jgi:predicted porin
MLKRLGIALFATTGFAALAHAADLPTTKAPAVKPPANCFASFWTWLDSTAADCPLSYAGFTLYATLDAGLMYNTNGAPWNPAFVNGTQGLISKQSNGAKWLWSPNNINQSVVGVKMLEPLGGGWSLVGAVEAGFDPLSGYLADSQRAQVMNNGKALVLQSANGDSSRAGQWDNSQGFLGVSHPGFGTLTAGRVNALSLDTLIAYDAMGSAYAFSPFGFTGAYAGFGNTELARSNTGVKYRVNAYNFRVSGLVQVGGYDQGNGSSSMLQGGLGGDFGNLSFDGVVSWTTDSVNTSPLISSSPLTSAIPKYYSADDLKATLSNNLGLILAAKYKWNTVTFLAGYEFWRQANPSYDYPDGFETVGGYNVPGNIIGNKNFPTVWVTSNAYNLDKLENVFWLGAKWAVRPDTDLIGAFYYAEQNNFNSTVSKGFVVPAACTGTGVHISSSACAGAFDAFSFMVDYRPVKRVDLYAGVALSNVYGGMANGYIKAQNIDPTVGLRLRF